MGGKPAKRYEKSSQGAPTAAMSTDEQGQDTTHNTQRGNAMATARLERTGGLTSSSAPCMRSHRESTETADFRAASVLPER
ncbi:hypothetical protein F503_07978 [Ophiostoma piceae UAMH 11346]|uniref:Uncharacterized protein n=1 Tax=Ophiostoma piceae (strain UAMH 11346) TaxID=1262450 RepID=S3C3H2_OPHP1|nr:hypothetical protein F503_07978 [Ophiostoma piceae UAMH 11346]